MQINELIDTLTIEQLLTRPGWESFTEQNILEIANKGCFGLYVKSTRKRTTYRDIESGIDNLISQAKRLGELDGDKHECLIGAGINPEAEQIYYQQLKKELSSFKQNHPDLLIKKSGYERLATESETKIYSSALTGSIKRLIKSGKIEFYELTEIAFGFVSDNDKAMRSNHYLLYSYPNPATGKYPENYKRFYSIKDLYFFVEQIKKFESRSDFSDSSPDPIQPRDTQKKIKQKHSITTKPWLRENTLKIALAVILTEIETTIPYATSIYEKAKNRKGDSKILVKKGGVDLIKRWIGAENFPLNSPLRHKESQNEIVLGVMLNIAYRKKQEFDLKKPDESINKIVDGVAQILKDHYQIIRSIEEIQSLGARSISLLPCNLS